MAFEVIRSEDCEYNFGRFRLLLPQRLILDADTPLRVGSRALEILLVLVERAGEVVGKDELLARVWPNLMVGEATVRVHIAALRRVLEDGRGGGRYIENIPGRGYRFVAPLMRSLGKTTVRDATPSAGRFSSPPALLTRPIGRSGIVAALAERLPEQRSLTLVGPGGIGKTTVAVAIAEHLFRATGREACFVDLSSIENPDAVPSAVVAALGLATHSIDPVAMLVAFLESNPRLVVLDNCEHVIDPAARIAEAVIGNAPGAFILATSREPLRAAGEWVHRLGPLDFPSEGETPNATQAMGFSAIELLVERATAAVDTFELTDADAVAATELCRHLDGIPLAIELAAAHVELLGVRGVAARLDDRFELLIRGRRTSPHRQQTLRATLDWSYEPLSPDEKLVFTRLSVFPDRFDTTSAVAVASGADMTADEVLDSLSKLAAKSLVSVDIGSDPVLFRLLDTARAYAREKLAANGECAAIRCRHARLCRGWVAKADLDAQSSEA